MSRLNALKPRFELPRGQSLSLIPKPANLTETTHKRNRNSIRIVVAQEHELSRQSLRALLQSQDGFRVVGDAGTVIEAVALAKRSKAKVLLLDTSSETFTTDQLRDAIQSDSDIRVLILASPQNKGLIIRAMEMGVRGAVLKSSSSGVLLEAIRCVDKGEYWVSSEILGSLIQSIKEKVHSGRTGNARGKFGLTAREQDMVNAVLEGYSNPEIASRFGLSEQTVKNHLSHVFDKVGVYSRVELALFAVNHRIAADSESPGAANG